MSVYKKICKECNIHYKSKGNGSKYCSKECRQRSRFKERTYIDCLICKAPTRIYPNKQKNPFLCSNKCKSIWLSNNSKELKLSQRASKMRENWSEESWKKGIETRKENGHIINWKTSEWKQYWRKCDWLTRKIRSQMLENWDGYDYIDGEYIRENTNLHFSHSNYPTLDHIKSRSQCFKEGLSPYEATCVENLKWTKRINNSRKHNKYHENTNTQTTTTPKIKR